MKSNLIITIVCTGIYHVEAFCVKQETLSAAQLQISQAVKLCLSTVMIKTLYHLSAYCQVEILLLYVALRNRHEQIKQ